MIGQTNTGIYKGVAYDEPFRVINERHQFFKERNFVLGSVIYDGLPYSHLQLKYDVYNDELLIRNSEAVGFPVMIFDKNKVANFSIKKYSFKKIDTVLAGEKKLMGYFEVLLKTDSLVFYKKHSKKLLTRTDQKVVYHEFRDGYSYYLYFENNYYRLKKVNDLGGIFPKYRKSLKTLRNRHASQRKSSPDIYMISILSDLFGLISNNSDN